MPLPINRFATPPGTAVARPPLALSPLVQQRLPEIPDEPKRKKQGLRTHQIRVLRVLNEAAGPLSRLKISQRANVTRTVVDRALGLPDPTRREVFEREAKEGGFPSLITLGMVDEDTLDIDGVHETVYELTEVGIAAAQETADVKLPTPRDSYSDKRHK